MLLLLVKQYPLSYYLIRNSWLCCGDNVSCRSIVLKDMQAHLLRNSRRLNRALPCLKNNRERLPIVKLLALAKSFTLFLEIIMDITDIRKCAQAFATYYLESFYIVVT